MVSTKSEWVTRPFLLLSENKNKAHIEALLLNNNSYHRKTDWTSTRIFVAETVTIRSACRTQVSRTTNKNKMNDEQPTINEMQFS